VADGVKIELDAIIGRTYTVPELREEYDALFLAVGAGLPVFMNVPGENYKGVYSANEYLTRVNLMGAWTRIPRHRSSTASGSWSSAAATWPWTRCERPGASVRRKATIVYRARTTSCRPARRRSTTRSRRAFRFEFLAAPLEVLADENRWVTGLRVQKMELGEPDASGRRRPKPIPGSEFTIDCDLVVVAIGTKANPLLTGSAPELQVNEWAT